LAGEYARKYVRGAYVISLKKKIWELAREAKSDPRANIITKQQKHEDQATTGGG